MADQQIQRAVLLVQQQKYKEAEKVLGGLFAERPDNAEILGLMSETKIGQNKFDEALDLIGKAIGIEPDNADFFYTRARILIQKEKYAMAESDLRTAINIDPYDAYYFALLALLKIEEKSFEEALEIANKALEIDPDNVMALNARSTTLLKLNRKEESFATIEKALSDDPDNAYTHANRGWGLLEKGDVTIALKHFSEALRKEPDLELARSGMTEALKARYLVYRCFLRYSLWMGNLQAKYQWGIIIGFYVLIRMLRGIANSNESLSPFLTPAIILLGIIAFSSWIITPVSNLFLRLNKHGKFLLHKYEIISSNLVGLSLLIAAAGGLAIITTGNNAFFSVVIFGILMLIPLGSALTPASKRNILIGYTVLLAICGIAGILLSFLKGELWNAPFIGYIVGVYIYQWVANAVLVR